MKKILFFATLLTLAFTSCSKEEIGGTATQSGAGQWYVQIDGVDENDEVIPGYEDYFGAGCTVLLTYNTSDNTSNEMWIDDRGEYNLPDLYGQPYPNYAIKTKVNFDAATLTFTSTESANIAADGIYEYEDDNGDAHELVLEAMPVSIQGKILPGAGHQNNGSPADSIVIFVTYKDDPWFPDDGYARYKISGVRYSGLVEND